MSSSAEANKTRPARWPCLLTFVVTDDGRGFDPAFTTGGSGLQGMEDRLGAQDGELTVTSSPGCGTTIEGRLSLATAAEVPA